MKYLFAAFALPVAAALSGCATGGTISTSIAAEPATAIQGTVHAGSHAVAGAHVYLMKVNPAGNGQPSVSLLESSVTSTADGVGAYVLTDANGNFAVPAGYSCTGTDQVYLYVLGGNAGNGANSAVGMLALIGDCPVAAFSGLTTVNVNEMSTVATAYALAGFAADATHISFSGSALAQTGLGNAVATASNLYSPSTGLALNTTPAGNGQVPYETLNTLANMLSACIQSSAASSAACTTLLTNAPSDVYQGALPTDTASAAINIAHLPGNNVAALYSIAAPNKPFAPSLPTAPNDFSIGINYTGAGLSGPYSVAVDASGDVWFTNLDNSTVSKLSPLGAPLSPASGFNNGGPLGPVGITIDPSGNAWIVNAISASLTKYSSSGALLSPQSGYTGGGLVVPQAIASDALGNAWAVNYMGSASKFSNGGIAISPPGGYTGGGIGGPVGIAIDASGSAWIANTQGSPNSITKLSAAGAPLSPPSGFFGGGITNPFSVAIDAQGNAWVASFGSNSIAKLSNSGVVLSPASGFTGGGLSLPYSIAIDGAGNAWVANSGAYSITEIANDGTVLSPAGGYTGGILNGPQAIATDGSGNVWIANSNDITVTELVGAAVPVVTPLVTGVRNNTLGTRP